MSAEYDYVRRELRNETVCSYCGSLRRIVPLARTTETWHDSAECVVGPEPSYKMGGPA